MSEISINTLKTMLANLDDAKKYQSLRDVMETLPAPDLAAVFEDLPAEKLPVLFRLCPKDRRRLPCIKLYRIYSPCTGEGRYDADSGNLD